MIARNDGLKRLVAAALSIAKKPESAASETIRAGDSRYRLITRYDDAGGWIVVLIELPLSNTICEDTGKECYGLTDRQLEVARLLANRYTNREIAAHFGFTLHTASRHAERIMRKLGVTRRKDILAKLQP